MAEQLTQVQLDKIAHDLANAASMVKLVTGTAGNAAILVMMDAMDKVKQHPRYKHDVKHAFKQAEAARIAYERRLLHAEYNRFFRVADMTEGSRKAYGKDFTDNQYFEFWQGLGGPIYTKSRPFVTSLWNKYRLSLMNHGIKHPDIVAWPMTAMSCLQLAQKMFQRTLDEIIAQYQMPRRLIVRIFKDFDLGDVIKAWYKAVDILDSTRYQLEETEDKNIAVGLEQLVDCWKDPDTLYDAVMKVIPDYGEIFRTKGEMKKALRQIAEVREATDEAIAQQ